MANDKGTLSHAMSKLLASGKGADFTLFAGDGKFKAHRLILSARSPVFAAMLEHDMLESSSGCIHIPDIEAPVMQLLLSYIYTDQVPELKGVAGELLAAADKYDLSVLKELCEEQLLKDLTVENVAESAVLALQHSCPRLLNSAIDTIILDRMRALSSEGWHEGMRKCPKLIKRIYQLVEEEISAERCQEREDEMLKAAEHGKVATLRLLLAQGVDVNALCDKGYSALHKAVKCGDFNTVHCLLDAGANVDIKNDWLQTPLQIAAGCGNVPVLKLLVQYGADVDAEDMYGQTALHIASACGEAGVVSALLQAKADLDAGSHCGQTPLQLAMAYNRKRVIDLLSCNCMSAR